MTAPTAGPWPLPRPDRLAVVGVLNVTPDSFSDGGRFVEVEAAVTHGMEMWRAGADLIDVGGESTRPGAGRVPIEVETRRVLPVITELARRGAPVSVDTMRATVAEAALSAGAVAVNDVSGGLADPDLPRVVAASGAPYFLMHWRGHSRDMHELANYADVVTDVARELTERIDGAVAAGIAPDRLVIDPGLGFAKNAKHNWTLLARLDEVCAIGPPVLVGASRKSFLGRLLADPDGKPRPVYEREAATAALTVVAALRGAWGVRVHDVPTNVDALRAVAALREAEAGRPVSTWPPAPDDRPEPPGGARDQ